MSWEVYLSFSKQKIIENTGVKCFSYNWDWNFFFLSPENGMQLSDGLFIFNFSRLFPKLKISKAWLRINIIYKFQKPVSYLFFTKWQYWPQLSILSSCVSQKCRWNKFWRGQLRPHDGLKTQYRCNEMKAVFMMHWDMIGQPCHFSMKKSGQWRAAVG